MLLSGRTAGGPPDRICPYMFYAMAELAQKSLELKEKPSVPNSFTRCDFRKLCKDDKYDKFENALIYLNDDQEKIARELDKIAKKHGLSRLVKSGFDAEYGLVYKYKVINYSALTAEITYLYGWGSPTTVARSRDAAVTIPQPTSSLLHSKPTQKT